ncbi:hypothetical protein K2Z84_34470 [Candidatus Binatia bacterium]|nr:hypothetical protein [Candidatus Binatia bacterium]
MSSADGWTGRRARGRRILGRDEARMFERHPHFAIFPGEAVEIMEVLPIPGM